MTEDEKLDIEDDFKSTPDNDEQMYCKLLLSGDDVRYCVSKCSRPAGVNVDP